MALCAPRPVLFTNGRDDAWINPEGQFEVMRAAAPVYRLLGAGDFAAAKLPPDGQLIASALGYFLRPGGHSLEPEDWKAFLDFADRHLGSPVAYLPRGGALNLDLQSAARLDATGAACGAPTGLRTVEGAAAPGRGIGRAPSPPVTPARSRH